MTGRDDPRAPRPPAGVDEALELLLPDADEGRRGQAERVADFLRLLQADAARSGESVALDLDHARLDLARSGRERLVAALDDLCAHHMAALLGPDRFLSPTAPERAAPAAWRALESLRAEYDGLAELPSPGEATDVVAARLVESLARHAGDASAAPWHAVLVAALRGPREGEEAFRRLADALEQEEAAEDRVAESNGAADARAATRWTADDARANAWCGVLACLLDRGAVHPAADLAATLAPRFGRHGRFARLAVWARLLCGDVDGARADDARLGPWRGALPGALVRLRRDWPATATVLSGAASRARRDAPPVPATVDRAAFGAQLVAVVRLDADGAADLVACDATAGLRARAERWFEDREDAARRAGTPEHRVVREARAVAWHRAAGADALEHSLGANDSRAALVQPLRGDGGECCGWLRLEFSHHLVPERARVEALAAAWRAELLRRRGRWEPRARDAWTARRVDDPELRAGFEGLARDLAIKTARRAWWGMVVGEGEPRLVASGGEGLGDPSDAPGGARMVARALACGGPVRGEDPDPGAYVHAQSAAGVVVCAALSGARVGVVVVESERRRDFSPEDAERFAEVARRWSLPLRLAEFRAHHRARHDVAPRFVVDTPGFRAFHAALVQAERGPAPLALVGPAGAGKRVVARWSWFEARAGEAPRAELSAREWIDRGASDDAYVRGVAELDVVEQRRVLEAIESGDGPRLAFGLREEPHCSARDGRLIPELAAWLVRARLRVPAFAERRGEVVALAVQRAEDVAAAAKVAPPRFTDDARAFLWRQAWAGNWRELDARLARLSRRGAAELDADALAAEWRSTGDEPVARVPSRDPDPALLRDALLATATAGGRANKRRAAAHLGWDPDTLAARLADAGLAGPDPAERGAAWRDGAC